MCLVDGCRGCGVFLIDSVAVARAKVRARTRTRIKSPAIRRAGCHGECGGRSSNGNVNAAKLQCALWMGKDISIGIGMNVCIAGDSESGGREM